MGQYAEKRQDRKSTGSRQKNERPVSKVESNDGPEIPNRAGEASDIPGLTSGSALQESLFIFNARSTTTVISGRNPSY